MNKNEPRQYIVQKKNLYEHLLEFLENENEDDVEISPNFQNLFQRENIEELKSIFRLILNISNNHHRTTLFDQKINQIILFIFNNIKQTLSKIDIFLIFKSNKRVLLLLLKNKIITIDQDILQIILNEDTYRLFFYPEIKSFLNAKQQKQIEEELLKIDKNIFNTFEQKREIGENDSYISLLIRKDLIAEFVSYVNRLNISLKKITIGKSIFETNSFLLDKMPTLIEYSSFFGSLKIIKYLQMNDIKLTPSLWIYGIHSQNPEIISFLEGNNIEPENNNYETCLMESIKCHHNDIANYIVENNNLYKKKSQLNENLSDEVKSTIVHYYNYSYFSNNIKSIPFFALYKYEHADIVNFLMEKTKKFSENKIILITKHLTRFYLNSSNDVFLCFCF